MVRGFGDEASTQTLAVSGLSLVQTILQITGGNGRAVQASSNYPSVINDPETGRLCLKLALEAKRPGRGGSDIGESILRKPSARHILEMLVIEALRKEKHTRRFGRVVMAQVSGFLQTLPVRKSEGSNPSGVNLYIIIVLRL